MSKVATFISTNIPPLGKVYAIGAIIVFVAVVAFWVWIFIQERKEWKKYPEEKREFVDNVDGLTLTEVLIMSAITATGCAIVWWSIPILMLTLWVYTKIDDNFPSLTGGAKEDIDKETEVSE